MSRSARWPIALLLAAHLGLLLHAAWHDAPTFDEPISLAGGIASWQGTHHVYPGGGDLPQRLEGLPLILAGVRLSPDAKKWALGDGFGFGADAVYRSGHDPRVLIFLARLPVALASVALALALHAIARRLLGGGAALVTLCLYAFSPCFLANGHLATADLLSSLTLLAATWLAGRCLERLTPGSLALSCAATAMAFLTKMSAILLPPIILLVVATRILAGAPLTIELRGRRLIASRAGVAGAAVGMIAAHAFVTILALWLAHGFRYSASPDRLPLCPTEGGWAAVEDAGPTAPFVRVAREHRLLPEAWLFGLQYTLENAAMRRAYAEGRYSMTGWWWYFPRVVALKTPLAVLALVPLGLLAFARAWRRGARLTVARDEGRTSAAWARSPRGCDLLALGPLLALGGVYLASALASNLNVGVRHVLPVLPVMLVIAGAAWRLGDSSKGWRGAVATLAALAGLAGLSAHPDHLAWMNVAAGPPATRWHHFVDSSLDWGQGLREAGAVAREVARPGEVIHLCYFGTAEPAPEGLTVRGLSSFGDRWRPVEGFVPGAGLFVVSATELVQLTSSSCPGRWLPLYESAWRASLERMRAWREGDGPARAALLEGSDGAGWRATLQQHDDLVAGRLCAYLREREPLRVISGGAMLMYRLDDQEVRDALFGPPVELAEGEPPFPLEPLGEP